MENRNFQVVENPRATLSMHPQKFALWLFIVSVVMLFAAFTSAYIVRKAEGNWLLFDIPNIFWYTSAVILVSSLTMHWAYVAAKKDHFSKLKISISITAILGLIFLVGQVWGWGELVTSGVYFAGNSSNPAGSFVYIFTGMHGLHLVSGVIVLLITFINVFRNKVNSQNLDGIEMCVTYWHFLDILWLYLFAFLLIN